jgi:hypothetical protein
MNVRLLDPRAGRFQQENRNGHQHEIERRVQHDRGHEPVAQVDEPPDQRGEKQLDGREYGGNPG